MNKCSILQEIRRAEDSIETCYKRVKNLEDKLKTRELPEDQKRIIENELLEVKKLLSTNQDHLSQLHGQNRRTFAVAASLFFIIFLLYGIYIMVTGGNL